MNLDPVPPVRPLLTHVIPDELVRHEAGIMDAHADVALKLFGDSTKSAKSEGRSKVTAKSNKAAAYMLLADAIFSVDNDPLIRSDFASNPNKYTKAVDNYIANT